MSIYIITNKVNSDANIYKIGKSTQSQVDLIKRYKTALGNPHLIFHHLCSDCDNVEKSIHNRLEEYRADGECFEVDYFVMLQSVIDVLKDNGNHFSEVVLSELDIVLLKLTKKDMSTLGIKSEKKDKMVVELKKNLSLLYRLESGVKMRITKTESEKEALKVIDSLISNINEEPLLIFEETLEEKATSALERGKSDFLTFVKDNPDSIEMLCNLTINNNKEDYIVDFVVEKNIVGMVTKFVRSRLYIIEKCIREGRIAILSILLTEEDDIQEYCTQAIDCDELDVIDLLLEKKDLKTDVVMYAAQNNKIEIVERYINSNKVTVKSNSKCGVIDAKLKQNSTPEKIVESYINSNKRVNRGNRCGMVDDKLRQNSTSEKVQHCIAPIFDSDSDSDDEYSYLTDNRVLKKEAISNNFVVDVLSNFNIKHLRKMGGSGISKTDVINSIHVKDIDKLITITNKWSNKVLSTCLFESNINAIAYYSALHGYNEILKEMFIKGANNLVLICLDLSCGDSKDLACEVVTHYKDALKLSYTEVIERFLNSSKVKFSFKQKNSIDTITDLFTLIKSYQHGSIYGIVKKESKSDRKIKASKDIPLTIPDRYIKASKIHTLTIPDDSDDDIF